MGGQATNLSVQLLQLLGVGGLGIDETVALLKDRRQRFDGLIAPGTQHIGMHLVLGRQLANRFGFLEQLQYELSFERGGVSFFHAIILPNPGRFVVQISGSTITIAST